MVVAERNFHGVLVEHDVDQGRRAGFVVPADAQLVQPARGVRARAVQDDATRRTLDRDRVQAGRPQPLLGPVVQVVGAGLGQLLDELVQVGVAVLVRLQVRVDALQEHVVTEVLGQLLEDRGALGVRDPVEVVERLAGVLQAVRRDRVGRAALVRLQAPPLADEGEVDPVAAVAGRVLGHPVRHVLRERLVQPHVVPPLHGDHVAEPHVRHLVHDDPGPRAALRLGRLAAEDQVVGERHAARVLHRAEVEVRHERLPVLAERVPLPEHPVVLVERLLGGPEHVLGLAVQVLLQRLPAGQSERDPVVLAP